MNGTFVLKFLEKLLKVRSQAGRLADTELSPAGGNTELLNKTISTFHPVLPPYNKYLILHHTAHHWQSTHHKYF